MPIPKRTHLNTNEADLQIQITDDGSRTLVRTDLGDAYHSGCGAISESRHVYLNNSGVADRLQQGLATRVFEVGLGTAMAALATIDLAQRFQTPLDYHAVDLRIPDAETLRQLNPESWIDDATLAERFLQWRSNTRSATAPGRVDWTVSDTVRLTVDLISLLDWPPAGTANDLKPFDAIYFDPFAPATDPQLWTESVFAKMRRHIAPEGRLVTYCVNRQVRDCMAAAGWSVDRVRGPVGGKREVLIASPGSGG
ncbi:tRNA (5-methylaminomethyl-2-thiouridine)(34)-methyltransferase MnmD [Crateriforma spongiae]|uniref:tRNA (5-methylaminomethyl-2-thiouridine)(34)-methyltransferase MnmD n=1 Tax=Crateriforma spongiae TaxID=2724528 RepID=UPI00144781F3|nr:tRNA (5-methylaminomethyl-2-thiouridine)(34)-methyltransferase MnmD [Crateriforma spongiae]